MLQYNKPEILVSSICNILRNYLNERRLYVLPRAHYHYVASTIMQLKSTYNDDYAFKVVRILLLTKKLHDYLLKYQSLSLLPKINHFVFGMLTVSTVGACELNDRKINNDLDAVIEKMLAVEIKKILEMICAMVLKEITLEREVEKDIRGKFLNNTFIDASRIKTIGFDNKEDLINGLYPPLKNQLNLLYNADGILFQRFGEIVLKCQTYGLMLLNLSKSLKLLDKTEKTITLQEKLILGKVFVVGFDDPFILTNACEINDKYQLVYNSKNDGISQVYYSITQQSMPIKEHALGMS